MEVKPEEPESVDQKPPEDYHASARSAGAGNALLVEGELGNVKYSYANCCNPIPGDDVIGFISRNGDVKIHRSSCKNAHHLIRTDSERIIDVTRSEEHTSELQSRGHLVCRL